MNPMTVAEGIDILATLLSTVSNAAAQATTVSSLISQAKAAGRDTFNDQEKAIIDNANAAARQALADAITKALLQHH